MMQFSIGSGVSINVAKVGKPHAMVVAMTQIMLLITEVEKSFSLVQEQIQKLTIQIVQFQEQDLHTLR